MALIKYVVCERKTSKNTFMNIESEELKCR